MTKRQLWNDLFTANNNNSTTIERPQKMFLVWHVWKSNNRTPLRSVCDISASTDSLNCACKLSSVTLHSWATDKKSLEHPIFFSQQLITPPFCFWKDIWIQYWYRTHIKSNNLDHLMSSRSDGILDFDRWVKNSTILFWKKRRGKKTFWSFTNNMITLTFSR